MLFKNVASQGLYIFAYDKTTGIGKTGDAGNITATISKDGAAANPTNTTNPTEIGVGIYWYPLSQAETNCNELVLMPISATSNILIKPVIAVTTGIFNYANLDAAISTRSTYSGGAVSSVTNPVTVGTNNDKSGYSVSSNSDKTGYSLTDTPATAADVLTQVNAALDAAGSELTSVPGAAGSLRQKLNFIFQYLGFKRTTTSSTETLFRVDNSTALGTSAVSDDGTTATHGKVS